MLSPRASVSNPAEKSCSQDGLSLKPMVRSALEPHKLHDQLLLGSNQSKEQSQQSPQCHSLQCASALSFQTPRGRPRHTSIHSEEPPSSAFLLDWGFLHQTAKFSKLLAENGANQNNHHEHSLTELQAELGRCCHRPLSQRGIALPPPLERPCKQFPKGERNCMACLLHQ